jgi:hypothetical protein
MYFDGSGDYLRASSSIMALSSNNFTAEVWIYLNALPTTDNWPTSWSSTMVILCVGSATTADGFNFIIGSTQMFVQNNDTKYGTATHGLTTNAWFHLAYVRISNTIYFYVNGIQKGSVAFSGAIGTGAYTWIGAETGEGAYFNGYISDLRLINGTALYTANFFPGTTPMTPTYTIGTSTYNATLLLNGTSAGAVDATRTVDLETVGDAKVVQNSPYNGTYYSLYGATGAGATITQTTATDLGSGSFTVEGWIYVTGVGSSAGAIITKRASDGALTGSWGLYLNTSYAVIFGGVGWGSTFTTSQTVLLNTWTHVAVTRSSTTLSIFLNGVRTSVAATTDSSNYTCSQYTFIKLWGNLSGTYPSGTAMTDGFLGYLSNLRIVQGSAVYNPASSTITVPTAPLAAVAGTTLLTCQSNKFVDNSTSALTITPYSTSQVAPQNPFRISTGVSYYFDGTGDYLKGYLTPVNYFNTGDYTFECWVYANSLAASKAGEQTLITHYTNGFLISIWTGNVHLAQDFVADKTDWASASVANGVWFHLAVTRSGTSTKCFVNGTQAGSTYTDSTSYTGSGSVYIGANNSGGTAFNGYIADMRVTKGYARYTTTFTPPTSNNLIL